MRKSIKVLIAKAEQMCETSEKISKWVLDNCNPEIVPVYSFRGANQELKEALAKVKGEA